MASYTKTFNFGQDELGKARVQAFERAAAKYNSLNEWVKMALDKAANFDAAKYVKGDSKE